MLEVTYKQVSINPSITSIADPHGDGYFQVPSHVTVTEKPPPCMFLAAPVALPRAARSADEDHVSVDRWIHQTNTSGSRVCDAPSPAIAATPSRVPPQKSEGPRPCARTLV